MCMYKDCEREETPRGLGLCPDHYAMYRMFVGKTLSWSALELMGHVKSRLAEPANMCSLCPNPARARGLCMKHYQQHRYAPVEPQLTQECEHVDCHKKVSIIDGKQMQGKQSGKKLCSVHYQEEFTGQALPAVKTGWQAKLT